MGMRDEDYTEHDLEFEKSLLFDPMSDDEDEMDFQLCAIGPPPTPALAQTDSSLSLGSSADKPSWNDPAPGALNSSGGTLKLAVSDDAMQIENQSDLASSTNSVEPLDYRRLLFLSDAIPLEDSANRLKRTFSELTDGVEVKTEPGTNDETLPPEAKKPKLGNTVVTASPVKGTPTTLNYFSHLTAQENQELTEIGVKLNDKKTFKSGLYALKDKMGTANDYLLAVLSLF